MDDYAGRVLADRYRLPLTPSDAYELTETRAFDTYSGQEVLIRQVPLPEVVEAEVLDAEGLPDGFTARDGAARRGGTRPGAAPADPVVRRAIEAAQAAAALPDHPRLDQVFDVFAEGGSLWIVSEYVAARPLAALLAEKPLSPYRAAEVASDVLTALRMLHAHGWVHRNITARTVLVCDDGRVMLTGLAVGAAEEALCGYDPVPEQGQETGPGQGTGTQGTPGASQAQALAAATGAAGDSGADPDAARRAALEARAGRMARGGPDTPRGLTPAAAPKTLDSAQDVRAARAGAIAAYRAGARAAARKQEVQQGSPAALPGPRPPASASDGPAPAPPGRTADPYGVGATARPIAAPHTNAGGPPAAGADSERTAPGDPAGHDALEAARTSGAAPPAGGDGPAAHAPARRGPTTALAAERARQARMAVVGPVTERWSPEQAGPVHDNWQLAAPVGPVTDLWALGCLLFRAVQGHPPYPEESTAELVQMVCAEPPAFAEECGPLRPVVESLLRQDPTERPDFEELRGWLRSLVRSAPEPEAGLHVIAAPPATDTRRLPVVRRRGELVRRRRAGLPARHGRHKRARTRTGSPRRLGWVLLLLVLLAMAAALAYATLFLPKTGEQDTGAGAAGRTAAGRTAAAGEIGTAPSAAGTDTDTDTDTPQSADSPGNGSEESAAAGGTQTAGSGIADGFVLREDPEGFSIAVAEGWQRTPKNGNGQVVYSRRDFQLIVVPGRDSAERHGSDPTAYQRDREPELQPYRDSSWATSTGLKTIEVGGRTMAEGQFTWIADAGELYVRNRAVLIDGRYHVVQVRGPEAQRDEVTRLYEQAVTTYRYTG